MIVISGALVLVALVLLIIGVVGPDLSFVYASIVVSLISLVFLVVGILQRRGETTPAAEGAPSPAPTPAPAAEGLTPVVPAQSGAARAAAQEPPAAASAALEPAASGTVLVVEGRPRYHVEGCRYLSGKAASGVDVAEAREEGFSPCGVCKPDEALAARTPAEEPATEEIALDDVAVEEPVVEPAEVPVRRGRTAATARKATPGAPAKAPATRAVKAPAAKAPTRAARTVTKPAPPAAPAAPTKAGRAVKAPGKAATAAAASTPAATTAAKRPGSVVVIPDRGKFHKPDCRFVRDAADAESMSRTAAGRAGYAACGVCKP